jgi:hypothetical protein
MKRGASGGKSEGFGDVFRWLHGIAEAYSSLAAVGEDLRQVYTLSARVGPATVEVRGPKVAGGYIPVVYLKTGKAYVSYHLMGLYMNPLLTSQISAELNKRKQGKTCFNFRRIEKELTDELSQLTKKSILALRTAGYII